MKAGREHRATEQAGRLLLMGLPEYRAPLMCSQGGDQTAIYPLGR